MKSLENWNVSSWWSSSNKEPKNALVKMPRIKSNRKIVRWRRVVSTVPLRTKVALTNGEILLAPSTRQPLASPALLLTAKFVDSLRKRRAICWLFSKTNERPKTSSEEGNVASEKKSWNVDVIASTNRTKCTALFFAKNDTVSEGFFLLNPSPTVMSFPFL